MRREIPRLSLDGQLPTGLIIDARSESEFIDDHIHGAINLPTMNDAERIEIGTLYKQVSPFSARLKGAAYANRNIARHLEGKLAHLPQGQEMWVYCWRGGQRSGSLALVLNEVGFRPRLINGGYKHWRNQVIEHLPRLITERQWRVLSGPTGSAKTWALAELARHGHPVLDLEGLGQHRGSLLGDVQGGQPGQRAFESRLYAALNQLPSTGPIWIESESANLGRLTVPAALMQEIHQAPQVEMKLPFDARVAFLIQDYPHWQQAPEQLKAQLNRLRARHSNAVVEQWNLWVEDGNWPALVADLLTRHYDPTYAHGAQRLNQQDRVQITADTPQQAVHQLLALT